MTTVIRVDGRVHTELLRRRLPGETNHDAVIVRALREQELEDRFRRCGLVTREMAELHDLRAMRGV
jgi:hypothetical protein